MHDIDLNQITIDKIRLPVLTDKKIDASVLRLDKIHPFISGNKWFKLKYYLEDARAQHKNHIVTYGGAWSNHLLATAAICRLSGVECTGIVRGESPAELSYTLQQAKQLGMSLQFMNRSDYKEKHLPDIYNAPNYYVIPEGGFGKRGVNGAATIADHFNADHYTHILCAVGTGTMLAGLVNTLGASHEITGIAVLKNNSGLKDSVESLLSGTNKFELNHDYHFGGYAKFTPELIGFMNGFYRDTTIPSDFVYTGKLFYGTIDLVQTDYFPKNSRLLLIHSGGLSGNESLEKGTLIF